MEPEFSQLRSVTEATPLRRRTQWSRDQTQGPAALPGTPLLQGWEIRCWAMQETEPAVTLGQAGESTAGWGGAGAHKPLENTSYTLLYNRIMLKSTMAEDVMLAPDLCSLTPFLLFNIHIMQCLSTQNCHLHLRTGMQDWAQCPAMELNHRGWDAAVVKGSYNNFIYSLWKCFRKQPMFTPMCGPTATLILIRKTRKVVLFTFWSWGKKVVSK